MDVLPVDLFTEGAALDYILNDGRSTFSITANTSRIHSTRTTGITITFRGSSHPRHFNIPLGPAYVTYSGVFIAATSQLVLATGRYIQIWKILSTPESTGAELELVWKLKDEGSEHSADFCHRKIASASVCQHGKHIALDFYPVRWFRKSKELPRIAKRNAMETATFPILPMDTIGTTEAFRINHGIQCQVELFAHGDFDCQQAVLHHLQTLVRPSSNVRCSAIATLCRFWTLEKKAYFEEIMANLLPTTHITWIPETQSENSIDPLAVILKTAESQPSAKRMAKIIMNYCVSHASSSRNMSFMTPIFDSWRTIMSLAPSEGLDCLDRMAFMPVQQRTYIINNHLIAHSPRPHLTFWKTNATPLWKTQDPVMQLQVAPRMPNPLNEQFTQPIFIASFNALWQQKQALPKAQARVSGSTSMWLRAIMYAAWLKLRLGNQIYVECKDSSLEYFDNPAITAMISYKWNTIGYKYWMLRFFFQCLYYILVMTVAILQVYLPNFRQLQNTFIAIICLSVIFLWLEMSRAIQRWTRYKATSYNVAGLLAYFLPLVAAVNQVVLITTTNLNGNARLLSFSVLAVFVNMVSPCQGQLLPFFFLANWHVSI